MNIQFRGFGQNVLFFNLMSFKFGNSFPQPKNDVTTTAWHLKAERSA